MKHVDCSKKYKNNAGLKYHLQHVHRDEMDVDDDDDYKPATSSAISAAASPAATSQHASGPVILTSPRHSTNATTTTGGVKGLFSHVKVLTRLIYN